MKNARIIIVLSMLMVMIIFSGCTNIQVGEAGIRNNKIWFFKTIVTVREGYCLNIPVIHDLTIYNVRLQTYEMTRNVMEGDKKGRDDIDFKTNDGQGANIDVTVVYQINPDDLVTFHKTIGDAYIKRVRDATRSVCRNELGKYTADEIYQGEIRYKVQEDVKRILNDTLKPNGLIIHNIMFRDFAFNKAYQDLVESKKQSEKQVEINEALALAAEAKAKETEALADGEARATRKKADANLYAKEKEAEGIRAIGEAEAAVKKALADAMGGGENIVRLEFAENIPDKLQIWGIPTGNNSVSFLDLSGFFKQMIPTPSHEPEPDNKTRSTPGEKKGKKQGNAESSSRR